MLHIDTDSIEDYFVQKMNEHLPETRVRKIINMMGRERGGGLRHRTYKERMTGKTEQWEVTKKLFEFHSKRLGFKQSERAVVDRVESVTNTAEPIQQTLF